MNNEKLLKVLREMEKVKSNIGDSKSYLLIHAIINMMEREEILNEYCEIYEVQQ